MKDAPSHRNPPRPGARRPRWQVGLARLLVRAMGWQLRGQLPPQFWRTTLVIWAPKSWQARLLRATMPIQVKVLCSPVDQWKQRSEEGLKNFADGCTNATTTSALRTDLEFIQRAADQSKSRITLCAWEPRRRFVHVHAPFKTSPFPDRDVHYMERYFKYFRQTTR